MMKGKQLSVMVHYQEQGGVTPTPAMIYPVTKIELLEIRDGQVVVGRTFIVSDDNPERWVEPQ